MRSIFLFIGCLTLTACLGSPTSIGEESSSGAISSAAITSSFASSVSSASSYTKPSDSELRTLLSPLQYDVTQHDGTEPPYRNEYWDNHEDGIYVDVVSGEPLFSSKDKYESGTGWPSFTRPLNAENIVERTDYQLVYPRTEVRSRLADSHLGHVFDDGPEPLGLRYCMNSAAMRFIPRDQLVVEGYAEFLELFPNQNP
jgi:peptide methionine sulfoxide reductase msrA/msrB